MGYRYVSGLVVACLAFVLIGCSSSPDSGSTGSGVGSAHQALYTCIVDCYEAPIPPGVKTVKVRKPVCPAVWASTQEEATKTAEENGHVIVGYMIWDRDSAQPRVIELPGKSIWTRRIAD
jgi:hypothetical protein